MADLLRLIESHGLHPHLYTDDNQIYGFSRQNDSAELQCRLEGFVSDVASWMQSNRLQLNSTKTEQSYSGAHQRVVDIRSRTHLLLSPRITLHQFVQSGIAAFVSILMYQCGLTL